MPRKKIDKFKVIDYLRLIRYKRNITLATVSYETGVSIRKIVRFEKHLSIPTYTFLERVCICLCIDYDLALRKGEIDDKNID